MDWLLSNTYGAASTADQCSYFSLLGDSEEDYGILLGYDEKALQPNTTRMTKISSFTKTANSIGNILLDAMKHFLKLRRDLLILQITIL